MKEDVYKFRKLCDLLSRDYGMSVNKVSIESGISWPTMKKLLEDDLDSIHIKASVLGMVQDYLHGKASIIQIAGISSLKIPKEEMVINVPEVIPEEDLEPQTFEEVNKSIEEEADEVPFNGQRVYKFPKGMVKTSPSIKSNGPMTMKQTRKYIRKDKGNVKEVIEAIPPEKTGTPLDHLVQGRKADKPSEVIEMRNLVQIIVFLRMEATRYRELAHDFEVSAAALEKKYTS